MNIYATPLFPYLAGEMLPADGVTMTVRYVRMEKIESERGSEEKPVMYFQERPKGMVLNKTNAKQLGAALGPETDDWTGAGVHLVPKAMKVAGADRVAIRIKKITQPAERKAQRAKANGSAPDPLADANKALY